MFAATSTKHTGQAEAASLLHFLTAMATHPWKTCRVEMRGLYTRVLVLLRMQASRRARVVVVVWRRGVYVLREGGVKRRCVWVTEIREYVWKDVVVEKRRERERESEEKILSLTGVRARGSQLVGRWAAGNLG